MKMAVILQNIVKSFGAQPVVNHINLEIPEGQLVTLLGPSGCGKTTLLRMIAGLLAPDEGEITIGDRMAFSSSKKISIPAEKRDIGMVFQSYAIWPHFTVFENVAYPLKLRKFPKAEIKDKVFKTLALLKMEHLSERYPGELSGGQQQRVALARALVYSPRLLLLDEPLANLDAQVRESVRFDIKELQRKTQVTTIYVTHDQSEAMVLSDKVVVIEKGVLVQEGPPSEIYCNPKTKFVAGFIGTSNFIPGTVASTTSHGVVVKTQEDEEIYCRWSESPEPAPGHKVLLCIRPEDFELHSTPPKRDRNVWKAKIQKTAFLGNIVLYWMDMAGRSLRVQGHPYFDIERKGDDVFLSLREDQIKVLPLAGSDVD